MALFQESLESPHRAIPFYLLVGMTIAPGLQARRAWSSRRVRAQPYRKLKVNVTPRPVA
jgi:hypothetical protein